MSSLKHSFSQAISYLFHPGIMPTVGAFFVLWSVPETYSWSTIFKITSTVFVGTYVSPLIAIFSKHWELIKYVNPVVLPDLILIKSTFSINFFVLE